MKLIYQICSNRVNSTDKIIEFQLACLFQLVQIGIIWHHVRLRQVGKIKNSLRRVLKWVQWIKPSQWWGPKILLLLRKRERVLTTRRTRANFLNEQRICLDHSRINNKLSQIISITHSRNSPKMFNCINNISIRGTRVMIMKIRLLSSMLTVLASRHWTISKALLLQMVYHNIKHSIHRQLGLKQILSNLHLQMESPLKNQAKEISSLLQLLLDTAIQRSTLSMIKDKLKIQYRTRIRQSEEAATLSLIIEDNRAWCNQKYLIGTTIHSRQGKLYNNDMWDSNRWDMRHRRFQEYHRVEATMALYKQQKIFKMDGVVVIS